MQYHTNYTFSFFKYYDKYLFNTHSFCTIKEHANLHTNHNQVNVNK